MAILKTISGPAVEVPEGILLTDAAKQLGVPFKCHTGKCGVCKVTIVRGAEHLNNQTEKETTLAIKENERCMCQAIIRDGEVTIDW